MDNPATPDLGWLAAFAGGTVLVGLLLSIALTLLCIWIGYTLLWRAIRRGIMTANGTWPPRKPQARYGASAVHDGPPTGPRDWRP